MGRVKGAVLTDRDRIVIAFLGLARFASTSQLQRLVADGRDDSIMHRRLRRLSADVNRPGDGPCVRRLEYRRAEGTAVAVWTLTPFGRAMAEELVPFLRAPGENDVAAQFMQHALLLTDVLLGLVLSLRQSEANPLAELPFRWLAENDDVLHFTIFRRETGQARPAVLKPDAILELPGTGRRVFIEAETGSQSIATTDPARYGAVIRKLERYARFFTAVAPGGGPRTFHDRAFPDGLAPELLFLVHSSGRKAKVERAVASWRREHGLEPFEVSVLTFSEAPQALAVRAGKGSVGLQRPRAVGMNQERARALQDGYNAVAAAMNATRRAVAEHAAVCPHRLVLPPPPLAALRVLHDLIKHDLIGVPVRQAGDT